MTSRTAMSRSELILIVLAARGTSFRFGRLVKAVFLVSRNIPGIVEPPFQFEPNFYGPHDPCVGGLVEELHQMGLAEIYPFELFDCYLYRATKSGAKRANEILSRLSDEERRYIDETSSVVNSGPLLGILRSIYEAHPDMRNDEIVSGWRTWGQVERAKLPAPPQNQS